MQNNTPLIDLADDLLPAPGEGRQDAAALIGQAPSLVDDSVLAPTITLSIGDLLPDANGEVVIMGGGEPAQINLLTDQKLSDSGVAESHITLDGVDVYGLSFFAFEGGLKLFYPNHLDIVLGPVDG
jgi:hypothetical protein